jgi:hypothetical protein
MAKKAKKGKAMAGTKDASSLFSAGFKVPSKGKGKGKGKKPSLKKGGARGRQNLLEKA